MKILGIIPARYASTRFPGKPLVDIKGKSMINRVYEQASKSLRKVVVATDDERIIDEVLKFGGNVVRTSGDHQSGTDRCKEALELFSLQEGETFDIVLNIQGDEPFINPEQINELASCFSNEDIDIATLIKRFGPDEDIHNHNLPKVIFNTRMEAIYFSRSVIPFVRGAKPNEWIDKHNYFRHIGMYAYRSNVLHKITDLPESSLEIAESLEQNRWIENGYCIAVRETAYNSIGIDTPSDLDRALEMMDDLNLI